MRGWRRSNRSINEGIHRSIVAQRPDLERLSCDTLVVGCWAHRTHRKPKLKKSSRYAEISLGIICGCMTAVPAFCRHVRDRAAKQQANPLNGQPHERDFIKPRLRPSVDVEMAETESASGLQSR